MYTSVAFAFAQLKKPGSACEAIQDMIDNGFVPNQLLVHTVLDAALDNCDAPSLGQVMQWLAMINSPMDRGTCQAVLNVAANQGDTALATHVWNLLGDVYKCPQTLPLFAAASD